MPAPSLAVRVTVAVPPEGILPGVIDTVDCERLTVPGVTVTPLQGLDITRRLGQVSFDGVEVADWSLVGDIGEGGTAIERQLRVAVVLTVVTGVSGSGKGTVLRRWRISATMPWIIFPSG